MAYVALYRVHRPQQFSEVAGQRHIVKTLQNAIKLNKVAHAYLFCGPRGTGKTSLAKIMAKALNCENGPNIEPCNACSNCLEITKGMISDVIEIDAASNNGVDEIREIRDKVRLSPALRYKIYIIDEVHMLSTGAFNALLKTLEEPPKHAIFILATTEVHKIPATILSRCQRFDFQSINQNDIFNKLKEVTEKENIQITDEALYGISEVCEGGMRDALSLLDQSVTYSNNEIISIDDILNCSGNVNKNHILSILKSCLNNDGANTIKLLNELIDGGKELPRIVNDLISFLRDVLLYKHNSLEVNLTIFNNEQFQEFCYSIKPYIIYSWLKTLNEALNNMKFSTQKQAFLELALLTMSNKLNNDYAVILEKVEELEKTIYEMQIKGVKPASNNGNYSSSFLDKSQIKKMSIDTNYDKNQQDNMPINSDDIIVDQNPSLIKSSTSADEFITIDMIEDVLNNGNKAKKELLTNILSKLKNSSEALVAMFSNGNVVASSDDVCLIVLADEAFCNRLMSYESFELLMRVINKNQEVIKDYICISQALWNIIIKDFTSKYDKNNQDTVIKLEDIKFKIKKHIKPSTKEQNPFVQEAIDLFGEEKIKIKED